MEDNNHIGRVVYSKAGRDAGKVFLIVGILNEQYVYLSDGNIKTMEKPKKKKIKHLIFTNIVEPDIYKCVVSGEEVSNSKIKRFLQSIDRNKEV